MQYCLLMHYQEGPDAGLTEEDMAPAATPSPNTPTTSMRPGC